jgi:putative endonuclease
MPWVYILRCSDETLYVGIAVDLNLRVKQHLEGLGGSYTSKRLPVILAYREKSPTMSEAMARERQIKRWSAPKKAAVIPATFAVFTCLRKGDVPRKASDAYALSSPSNRAEQHGDGSQRWQNMQITL